MKVLKSPLPHFWNSTPTNGTEATYGAKPDTGVSPPELLDFIQSHPPGRALDLGCGTGTNVITLAQHNWRVTGVDFASRAIGAARRKARQSSVDVDLRVADVTEEKGLAGLYDLILDIGCFHRLPEKGRQAYLHNLERLLAPEGTYLLYVFLRERSSAGSPGVTDAELAAFPGTLRLAERQDSTGRQRRPSAWLTFRKG